MATLSKLLCYLSLGHNDRIPKTRRNSSRRRGRLQPADRPRRGPHARTFARPAQRSDRSDDRGPQRAHRQAHGGRRARRVSFRGRCGALRHRSAERDGRTQRGRADRSPDRIPHRHSFGRCRRGERRRSHGRWRQHRSETGGDRPAGRDLSFGGRLPAGARKARPRSQRPGPNPAQEYRRPRARLFAPGRAARAGEAFCANGDGPARPTRKNPRRHSPFPTSPRSRCCRSRT